MHVFTDFEHLICASRLAFFSAVVASTASAWARYGAGKDSVSSRIKRMQRGKRKHNHPLKIHHAPTPPTAGRHAPRPVKNLYPALEGFISHHLCFCLGRWVQRNRCDQGWQKEQRWSGGCGPKKHRNNSVNRTVHEKSKDAFCPKGE